MKASSVKFGCSSIISNVILPCSASVQVAKLEPVVIQPDDPDTFKASTISCAIRVLSCLIALSSIEVTQRILALKKSEDSSGRNPYFLFPIRLLPVGIDSWVAPPVLHRYPKFCQTDRHHGHINIGTSLGLSCIKIVREYLIFLNLNK